MSPSDWRRAGSLPGTSILFFGIYFFSANRAPVSAPVDSGNQAIGWGFSMPFSLQCPSCGRQHQVGENMLGKRAQCSCGNVLNIPAARASNPAAAPQANQAGGGISVQCPTCGRQHTASPAMAGKAAQCACGGVVQIPGAPAAAGSFPGGGAGMDPLSQGPGSVFDDLSAAEMAATAAPPAYPGYAGYPGYGGYPHPRQQGQPAAAPRRSDDQVLAGYIKDESWKKPDSASQREGGFFAFESGILNGGTIGGMLAILAGIVLFVVPLLFGYIVPYSLILIVLGLVGVFRGLFSGN